MIDSSLHYLKLDYLLVFLLTYTQYDHKLNKTELVHYENVHFSEFYNVIYNRSIMERNVIAAICDPTFLLNTNMCISSNIYMYPITALVCNKWLYTVVIKKQQHITQKQANEAFLEEIKIYLFH